MIRVGIDVGGTSIKVGLVNEDLQIIASGSIPTRTDLPFAEQVAQIAQLVLDVLAQNQLSAEDVAFVGVGIPGIADEKTGDIIFCTNLGWHFDPFAREFKKHLDKPIIIDNDANVAALAESVAGVSKGTSSSVFITLGTGVGGGIIINGKVWKGFHGIGGELGHVIMKLDGVPCTCGNKGCLERYCSATAIIRMARTAVVRHKDSLIWQLCGGDTKKIEAKTVFDAAKAGDELGVKLFHKYTSYLAQAIGSIINLLDPEVIVVGGGVSKAGDFLLDPVRAEYPSHVLFRDLPMPEVKLATLGNDAGIIGAAMLG